MWALPAPGDGAGVVVKLAPEASVSREAAALRRLAGTGVAPALLATGPGVLVTARLPGASRPPGDLPAGAARALGALVRRVHDTEHPAAGEYDGWDGPEDDLAAYRRRRAADIGAGPDLPAPPAPAPAGGSPFRYLHGDLWNGNVVWDGARPVLVDWEYRRAGDPAEELAYLAAMDDLPAAALATVLEGYGAPELAAAVDWWRPRLAVECARWFAAEGDQDRARALRAQAARLTD